VDSGGASGAVTPISTATNTPGKPIRVGGSPYGAAITPDGKALYAASTPGVVIPISTATNTPGKLIKTGNTPWSIVCAPAVCRSSSTAG
jgi:DNA-binding beta-propeller fold protein YncE